MKFFLCFPSVVASALACFLSAISAGNLAAQPVNAAARNHSRESVLVSRGNPGHRADGLAFYIPRPPRAPLA